MRLVAWAMGDLLDISFRGYWQIMTGYGWWWRGRTAPTSVLVCYLRAETSAERSLRATGVICTETSTIGSLRWRWGRVFVFDVHATDSRRPGVWRICTVGGRRSGQTTGRSMPSMRGIGGPFHRLYDRAFSDDSAPFSRASDSKSLQMQREYSDLLNLRLEQHRFSGRQSRESDES